MADIQLMYILYTGKWHLGLSCQRYTDFCFHPLNQGFDHFYGLPLTNLKDFGNDGDSVVLTRLPYLDSCIASIMLGLPLLLIYLVKTGHLGPGKAVIFFVSIGILVLSVTFIYKNLKMLNSILMRNFDVVEQPIDLYDNLTEKLVREGVGFMEQQVQQDKPFLLIMSWVQVKSINLK